MLQEISLVIASRNKDKTAEIKNLLRDFPVKIKNLDEFGPLATVKENGKTFEANAYLKASFTARILGLPALADDSGLLVESLGGRPGVHSARYAGEDATDEQRCQKLLSELDGQSNRNAAFECVISVAVPSGLALTYEGRCEGLITEQPTGSKGFGYDPIFYFPPLGKTFAEMTSSKKSMVSHRGKALRELKDEFEKVLTWIRRNIFTER
jgi:XTP/dITP diphosphohydrolase